MISAFILIPCYVMNYYIRLNVFCNFCKPIILIMTLYNVITKLYIFIFVLYLYLCSKPLYTARPFHDITSIRGLIFDHSPLHGQRHGLSGPYTMSSMVSSSLCPCYTQRKHVSLPKYLTFLPVRIRIESLCLSS